VSQRSVYSHSGSMVAHPVTVGQPTVPELAIHSEHNGRRVIGLYGPPQSCKRKNKDWQLVCANVFGLWWGQMPPGHDGYPLALVPIMWTV
jgi:hypothetical protein